MNTYGIGAGVILSFQFEDGNGVATDPAAATVKVRRPSGQIDTYNLGQLTHAGPGHYTLEIVVAEAGRWKYRAEADGALQAATLDEAFVVEATATIP